MITRNPSSQKDPMRKFLNEDLILNRRWSLLGRVPPRLPPFTARTRVTLANPGEVERAHLKQICPPEASLTAMDSRQGKGRAVLAVG
jgi:hypothetical protein